VADTTPRTNTAFERLAVDAPINLSDGHARQPLHDWEHALLARFATYHQSAANVPQTESERRFATAFYDLANQRASQPTHLSYSASCLVKVVAQIFQASGKRLHILEPCFDNIRDLLTRSCGKLVSYSESDCLTIAETLGPDDVMWLTAPANPSGFEPGEKMFSDLVESMASTGTTLVCDFCFRFFSPNLYSWDQYQILERTDVPYVVLEDTGKTFPLLDLKVGLCQASESYSSLIHEHNEELLLNVSPVLLLLLADFAVEYQRIGLSEALWQPTERRRQIVLSWLDEKQVPCQVASVLHCTAPFVWLRLSDAIAATAMDISIACAETGVHILPGDRFFENQRVGERFLRVPLARADELIRTGLVDIAPALTNALKR
jgi:aspartate/methionine/tyrosine aminotransferase